MTRDFDYITLVSMPLVRVLPIVIFVVSVLTSCSSARKHTHPAPLLPGMSAEIPASDSEIPDLDRTTETSADDEDPVVDTQPHPQPKKRQIPFQFNQNVAKWIEYFSQKDRERFQRFFDRGEPYREVIQNILEENRVPTDLYYLGMIESGFNAHAKSSAKAVGVWQFMKSTGKLYGLKSDSWVDERRDPIRATEAAAKMLRDLYRQFNSWYLAMAAYNAGPGRIRGAIRRAGTQDFWELVERRKLPRETMDYVPKFLAARYIGENPDLFGFYINEEKRYPNVELVKVPSPVTLASIESSSALPGGTLAFVNPHFLRGHTHPRRSTDEVWVPEEHAKRVEARYSDLSAHRFQLKSIKPVEEGAGAGQFVLVKRGDTLRTLASRFGLSVSYLKRVNGLKGNSVQPGQRLRLSARSYRQERSHPRMSRKRRLGN
jgi:membrane-bound lytic murein transglycosylase D